MGGTSVTMILCTVLAVTVKVCSARMPATFKASMCYDVLGKASIRLRCPPGYSIETLTSFTGISRFNACSYMAWDCVIQEGATRRCDGQAECAVSVSYTETDTQTDTQSAALSCGDLGQTKYFQIEYECKSDDGRQAVVFEPSPTPRPPDIKTTVPPGAPSSPPQKDKDNTKQYTRREIESKVTLDDEKKELASPGCLCVETCQVPRRKHIDIYLNMVAAPSVAIVCGSAIAMIFVVVVMATLAHRIKKRIHENSSVYGLLTGGGGGLIERSPSRGSPLYSSYVGSQLSLQDSPRTSLSHLGGTLSPPPPPPPLPDYSHRPRKVVVGTPPGGTRRLDQV